MRDVKDYAAMVKLDLSDDELVQLSGRVSELSEGFALLDSIETSSVEPLVTVLNNKSILREDITEKNITRENILANAPEQYDGYFQVPGTIV